MFIICRILGSSPFSSRHISKYQKCRQHIVPPSPSNSTTSLLVFVNEKLENLPTIMHLAVDIFWSPLQPFFLGSQEKYEILVSPHCEHVYL